jgi:hypothetical protein
LALENTTLLQALHDLIKNVGQAPRVSGKMQRPDRGYQLLKHLGQLTKVSMGTSKIAAEIISVE